jgi:parallel beta-helix repeat protein
MAPRDILPGKDFAEAIIEAIENCRVFVLILSTSSANSPHVLREINKAASKGIPILSFIIEDVTLSKSMEYYLSTDHWLNATTPPLSRHIHNLALIVEKLLSELSGKTISNLDSDNTNRLNDITSFKVRVQQETAASNQPVPLYLETKPSPEDDMLIVDPKGSGDYRKINEAIDAARPNQKILVKSGTYREQILLTEKPVKLFGEGMDKVKVSYDSGSVLETKTVAGSEITGFSFSQNSYNENGTVCLIKSSIIMRDCRVSGGNTGIMIVSGKPVITNNLVERNINGLAVYGTSSPLLSENRCSNNNCAILFTEDTTGKAIKNECKSNHTGIIVTDNAQPILQENECNSNKENGISYLNNGAGKAIKNICKKNINGILITDHGQPTLENNQCNENREAGILYNGHEGGTARNNESSRNRSHGIQVCFKAQPLLEGNQCSRNKLMGITYLDSAAGTAQKNVCSNNDLHGISIKDRAQPDIEANRCSENREAGIAYFDNAQGVARDNICRGNRLKDITINGQATPILIPHN